MDWNYFENNTKWRCFFLIACAPCFFTFIAFLGYYHFLCEMTCSFRVHYFLTLLLLAIPFLISKRWKSALFLGLCALLNLSQFAHLYFNPIQAEVDKAQTRKHIFFNVYSANKNYSATVDFILKNNPETISLTEVTPIWERELLAGLKSEYPHIISQPQNNNFGMLFMSRKPFSGTIHTTSNIPYIEAHFTENDYTIFTIHPPPPLNHQLAQLKKSLLLDLIEKVNLREGSMLISGDFNMVPWSPHFQKLMKRANLKNSGVGFGISTTWPASSIILRIPLDHCLVSKDITISNKTVGPDLGSDHLPVIIEYNLP
jgi:endonuclease/exonuclease/phosphatase (EEP) superfamily protein YafD